MKVLVCDNLLGVKISAPQLLAVWTWGYHSTSPSLLPHWRSGDSNNFSRGVMSEFNDDERELLSSVLGTLSMLPNDGDEKRTVTREAVRTQVIPGHCAKC